MTPPPNMSRRNTANFQPWSLCGISFLAAGNLATSAVETPMRDALTRIVLRRLDAFSQAIFVGLLFEVDLDFTCTWSISLGFSPCSSVFRDKLHVWTRTILLRRRDPKVLQLLAVCPSFEQCTNWHRSIRVSVMFGNGLCPRATITISTWRYGIHWVLTDTIIYASIQISRGPFHDWIPFVSNASGNVSSEFCRTEGFTVHRTAFYNSRCAHFEYKVHRATQYLSLSVRLLSIWLFSQLDLIFHPPPVLVLRYFLSKNGDLNIHRIFPTIRLFGNSERRRRSYVNTSSFTMLYRTILCYHGSTTYTLHPVNRGRNVSQVVILLCSRRGKTRNDSQARMKIRKRTMRIAGKTERITTERCYISLDLRFCRMILATFAIDFSRVRILRNVTLFRGPLSSGQSG